MDMSDKLQYLTEAHYLICDKGAKPAHVKIDGRRTTKFSGNPVATEHDLQRSTNFICAGKVAFLAGFAVGLVAAAALCIPGPGWVIAGIIALAIAAALVKCKIAASSRFWVPETVATRVKVDGYCALTLNSVMMCPAEGGCVTAEPTIWSAWGKQTLTNLGHVANFAFGFLAGKGVGTMAMGASSAAGGAGSLLTKEGASTFAKELGKDFVSTAKNNLLEQFTGWNQGGLFCRLMKGFGLYGEITQYGDIWTDEDKSTFDKIKESGLAFILDVFAAKGATTVCFPAGTKVHTRWGLANIERLEVGVPILTYNEGSGETEYKKVKKLTMRTTRRMCILELSNGEMVEVTPEHRFYSNGEWIPIEEMEIGDTIECKDKTLLIIEKKTIIATFVQVYNLEVEDNENYYVTGDGILVHNGYKHGESDGGPGTWEDRTTPQKGADYQETVTGAPKDTEYVVKTDKMKSGEKKFDGYDSDTNTLLDAKDWDIWPPEGQKWAEDKIVETAKKDSQIAADACSSLEYHFPTQEKADEILDILDKNGVDGIKVVVTPK